MKISATVDKVSKRYGKLQALREVSVTLAQGELVALIGHNGAGKTTLMKLMLGLIRPSEGSIRVLGENPATGAFAARRQLGYLPENVAFNGALTGHETLSFYARLKREPSKVTPVLLERVGLTAAAARRVATYSKGMRQRLGLAQALLGSPRVLLLDEPTTGLDPEFRQQFFEIMRELRDNGAAVLLSSHALTELEERADRAIIMNRGAVIAAGTLVELRHLAQLPSRILVTMAEGAPTTPVVKLAPANSVHRVNGHTIELVCSERDKLAMIRRVAAEGIGVANIETVPPTLDDLYAHFLRNPEPAR
jgi:Cu-processing system ATP-binding protein